MQTKLTLGYLGFLPFAALTILPWILGEGYEKISFQLLVAYGGIIISFLSGIIWGINTSTQKNLTISIVFSLLGFGAILLAWINLIYAMILLFFLFYVFYLFCFVCNFTCLCLPYFRRNINIRLFYVSQSDWKCNTDVIALLSIH